MTPSSETSRLKLWSERLALGPARIAGLALMFLMVLTFVDVISRSVFSAPLGFSAELTEISMAVIVFAALPMATLHDGHIVVDLLDKLFQGKAAYLRDMMVDVVCLVSLAYPAVRVWTLGTRSRSYNEITEILGWPQFYLIYFVSIALFGCCAVYVLRILIRFQTGASPQREASC
ncbi:TRAP transporter small permease [Ruegeria sp. ANG-R]|uniref:TRAP transporter small permease n=1 Tax=Ruegeria sp. ANG-R TaxID=1577903 RepID=UPI0019D3A1D4|nr:TRAP transporter small permease [Ruegeria sp. ANG-R]